MGDHGNMLDSLDGLFVIETHWDSYWLVCSGNHHKIEEPFEVVFDALSEFSVDELKKMSPPEQKA